MIKKFFIAIFVIVIIALLGYVLQDRFSFVRNIELSRHNVEKIDSIVLKENIIGVQVIKINLQDNTRRIVYSKYSDPQITKLHRSFVENSVTIEVPVFTKDEINNSRIIRIINNEFVCTPFKETMSYKYAPEASEKVSAVCALSVPPSYGKFLGIIGIFFVKEPSVEEKDATRILLKTLSESLTDDLSN